MRRETSQQREAQWNLLINSKKGHNKRQFLLFCTVILFRQMETRALLFFPSFSLSFMHYLCRVEVRWDATHPGSRCLWNHKEPALLMWLIAELASKPAATVPLPGLLWTWHHHAGVGWNVERMHPRWQPLTGFSDAISPSELLATLTCLSFSLLCQKALRPKWKWIRVGWGWCHWYEAMDVASGQTVNSWFVFRDI